MENRGSEQDCPALNLSGLGSSRARFQGRLTKLTRLAGAVDTKGGSSATGAGTSPGATGDRAATGSGNTAVNSSQLESGDAGAPSVLSALPTVADTPQSAKQTLALVVLVVILVLLIAFPTHLLNTAMESGHEKLSAFRRRRRNLPEDAADAPPVASVRTWAVAAVVVLAASVISAFVDPGFGANPGSLRVLGSLFLALAVESLLVWFAVILVTRRTSPDTVAGFHAAPATLLVVALAVVLTRLTGFEPGIIFGLVAGVTFATAAGDAAQGKVALAGTGWRSGSPWSAGSGTAARARGRPTPGSRAPSPPRPSPASPSPGSPHCPWP